jgi:protein-disulfide isomerase
MTEENQSPEQIEDLPSEEESQQVEGSGSPSGEVTITLRKGHLYIIVMPLIFIVGITLGFLVRGWVPLLTTSESAAVQDTASADPSAGDTSETSVQSNPISPVETPQVVRYEIPVDDDPFFGAVDAPITIVEFSDYECPYCRTWHTEVYSQLIDAYGDQVRFVYRDFPLESIHANAKPAAEAANCANEQGEFWEYHDKLFSMELGLSPEAYQEYATQLGLDIDEFQECFESGRYQEEVQLDFEFAANLGVRSTPTFFVNGIAVVGAQPFEVFQQVIEKELAGEIP